MKPLILLILLMKLCALDVGITDDTVYIFGAQSGDDLGYGVEASSNYTEWHKLDMSHGYKRTKISVSKDDSEWIKNMISRIAKDFKPVTGKISGPGYRSVSLVFGKIESNWTLYIGWNAINGIKPSDDVTLLDEKLRGLTSQ